MVLTACGQTHTICLDPFGCLWVFGSNELGQIGCPESWIEKIPKQLQDLPRMKSVACGRYHTLCCDENGDVWSFGYNCHGQLGTGNTETARSPTKLPRFSEITDVRCGYAHSVCIDTYNSCWSFGFNQHHQLGHSEEENQVSSAKRILSPSQVKDVHCGGNFTVCIEKYGRVSCFGANQYGQLGLQSPIIEKPTIVPSLHNIVDAACGETHNIFLQNSGAVLYCGQGSLVGENQKITEPLIMPLPPIVKISTFAGGSIAVDREGNVWKFAALQSVEPSELPVQDVSGFSRGLFGHIFLYTSGTVWSMGSNSDGQLGFPDFMDRKQLTQLPEELALIWRESRTRAKSALK
mmetsp:Transcript_14444/g.18333  ORF Transcript_14444/g.18333 Transcript_14444/m.18333 type:complete len:349 (-) Transcript_14444:542-1588(-)